MSFSEGQPTDQTGKVPGNAKEPPQHGSYLAPGDVRIEGETTALYVTLALIGVCLLYFAAVSVGSVLIFIGIAVAIIKLRQGQLLGQGVKVSNRLLPEVFQTANRAAEHLTMHVPDIFVVQDPTINAYALGFLGRKSVVLHSATVEAMTSKELEYVIGHELTHIKCDHTIWLALTSAKDKVRVPILSDLLSFIFLYWSRKAEYTSDRGGLIASGDIRASVSALAKIAVGKELSDKLNSDFDVDHLKDIEKDDVAKIAQLMVSHPYIANRIQALRTFSESDTYRRLCHRASGEEMAKTAAGGASSAPSM